jgi:hypothetical protein
VSLPLSKTLDPHDYLDLDPELQTVAFYDLNGQHPHRRWEYALALRAIETQRQWTGVHRGPIYDVGGAGTPFHQILQHWTARPVEVIDPRVNVALQDWVVGGAPLADVITCVSVIEHVGDLPAFLYHLTCLLAPGGLLVLTMDYWNKCGPDTAERHEDRVRIFCPRSYASLRLQLASLRLHTVGGVDQVYHGAQVHDYTFASLVLEKRR